MTVTASKIAKLSDIYLEGTGVFLTVSVSESPNEIK